MDKPHLERDISGVWCKHDAGDVHIYVGKPHGVVIGTNKSYKDKIEFSDMALAVDLDGQAVFQYADSNGSPKFIKVSDDTWKLVLLGVLEELKAKALKEASEPIL